MVRPLTEVVTRRSGAASMEASLSELNMSREPLDTTTVHHGGIDLSSSAPPVKMPLGHVGEFVIPGTGRLIWWTGRVAIGLLHQPVRYFEPVAESSLWVQRLMLGKSRRIGAARA